MNPEPDFTTEPGLCGVTRWKDHPFPDPEPGPAETAPVSPKKPAKAGTAEEAK
jgi:hypothetical protein